MFLQILCPEAQINENFTLSHPLTSPEKEKAIHSHNSWMLEALVKKLSHL